MNRCYAKLSAVMSVASTNCRESIATFRGSIKVRGGPLEACEVEGEREGLKGKMEAAIIFSVFWLWQAREVRVSLPAGGGYVGQKQGTSGTDRHKQAKS